jgi:type 1 glutamine amidotransferase
MGRKPQVVALAVTMLVTMLGTVPAAAGAEEASQLPGSETPTVLVFHGPDAPPERTQAGIEAVEAISAQGPSDEHFDVETTDDPAVFHPTELMDYNAVVFLSAEGAVLNDSQESALQNYIRMGGGFVGVHDAALAQPESEWFTGLIGARPEGGTGEVQTAVVETGDRVNPATRGIPLEWSRRDVWFNWETNPSGQVHTLARVRESSYEPGEGAEGWDHPISWCRDYDGGRSFYTGMGGTVSSFTEESFRKHLRGALLWTSRLTRADCQATIDANYVAERLTEPNTPGELDQIGEPHGLDIADDGRVFYIGRGGAAPDAPVVTDWDDPQVGLGQGTVHVYDPATGEVSLAASLEVFGNKGNGEELVKNEEGLLGIALDPGFLDNNWIYLHWTPHSEIDRETHMAERRVSRFTFDPESSTLDLSSEQVLLSWPVQIHSCCHAGGGMDFDSEGNLYIATGDNNSSGFSDGYSGNNPEPQFEGVSFAIPPGSRSTPRPTGSTRAGSARTPPNPALSGDRPSTTRSPSSPRRATRAGRTAWATTSPTGTATCPTRRSRSTGTTATTSGTSPRTTTAWWSSPPPRRTTSGTRPRAALPTSRATPTACPATTWTSRRCCCRG